jgi:Tfp pilus assembly protein PilO
MTIWKTLTRHSVWLISVPLVGSLVAYLLLFYMPGRREMQSLREQLQSTEATIAESELIVAKIPAVQSELELAQEYIRKWGTQVPPTHQVVDVFGQISRLGAEVGTPPTRFTPDKSVDLRFLRQVPVELACSGRFEDLREFVNRLEGLPQFIWIESLNISPLAPKDGETAKLAKCEMRLVLFGGQQEISDYVEPSHSR